ncbi:transporter substrate-binding domain-containing protein [Alphaproteobacteria bacterium KMM 3653]|uniref:histidine kinase n=1 Tax=Harenicola maris TaxID=2841044 RepID=A0AAP2CPJ3_9RHOB|nr:transporter substrate-binding domain-containing protein [Harenicola maris]
MVSLLLVVLLIGSGALRAQTDRPTLTVGWVLSPPVWGMEEDGTKSGLFIEFAQMIADDLNHELVIKEYPTAGAAVLGQNAGETDMMAGAVAFDVFGADNLFSDPIGQTQSRMFVHIDRADGWDANTVSGEVISYVAQTLTPEVDAISQRNIGVQVPNLDSGIMGVLSGNQAAFIYPEEAASYLLREARIDHLVVPVGEPVSVVDRVVVLHRSRADLLGPINDVIAQMKAQGRLDALFAKNRVEIYDPAPEVLTVAFPEFDASFGGPSGFAPSYVLDENGAPSGYAIEIFRAVADRAGLKYEFRTISPNLIVQGPAAAGVDIIPSLGISEARREIMDQTVPAGHLEISATVRSEDAKALAAPADLSGKNVGVIEGSYAFIRAQRDPTVNAVTFDTPDEMLDGLMAEQVDAVLMLRTHIAELADQRGYPSKISELDQSMYEAERAISLRFGLGQAREALNRELPGYLLSAEFAELREKYYGAPVFWNEARLRQLTTGLIVLAVLVLGLLFAFLASERARRRAKRANERAEAARLEAVDLSSRLHAVMEASSNGVVALDRHGQVAMMNSQARDLLEIGEGRHWPQDQGAAYFADEEGEALKGEEDPFRRALKSQSMEGILYQFHGEGAKKPKHIRVSSSTIPPEASGEIGTVVVLNDVTEYERQRKESLRSGRMSAVGQLTGGVAHDFNNLLAVIMGNLELMKETRDDPKLDEMIDAGLAATRHGADLTMSLLAFARQSRLEVEVLDLNSVILDAQNWMRRALPASITVETSLLAGIWPVELDRSSLESALLNLIVNARDAMGGMGRLTIETANLRIDEAYVDSRDEELAVGRYVLLAVSDTGSGISEQNLDRLFEPFFTTKGPGEGSGVGLSMVQGFVKQSGGTVQVYSELGVGTTFKLYFPASKDAVMPISGQDSKAPTVAKNTARILLAEDNKEVRKVLDTILKGAGYTVVTAKTGDEALELFHSEPKFDLLITDIVMPGKLQGTDLAKAIRPLQPDLPFIFMSGYAAEATVHGNGLRPEDVRLMKPAGKEDLLDAVEQQLKIARE